MMNNRDVKCDPFAITVILVIDTDYQSEVINDHYGDHIANEYRQILSELLNVSPSTVSVAVELREGSLEVSVTTFLNTVADMLIWLGKIGGGLYAVKKILKISADLAATRVIAPLGKMNVKKSEVHVGKVITILDQYRKGEIGFGRFVREIFAIHKDLKDNEDYERYERAFEAFAELHERREAQQTQQTPAQRELRAFMMPD